MTNIKNDTANRRLLASIGINPNAEGIEYQATTTTTTTTTETTNYRTPYAALQKAVEDNLVTLLLASRNGEVDSVSNELLFEKSTLGYEDGSTYAGNKIHADTSGVYIDITKTGEVNLRSGTVTVTPANAQYVLTLGGTGLNADGSAIEGGYKITSKTPYTLDADDDTTRILTENGGGASITIPHAGESVTVEYTDGTKVTYTATKANDKFYLGHYVVTYEVNTNAIQQNHNSPYHGQTFTQVFEANSGYELEGGCFSVYRKTRDGGEVKINLIKDDALSDPGQYTVYSGEDVIGNDTGGSLGKVTVKQIHLAGDANVTGGNRNGNVEVTIENVRSDIVIKTEGEAVKTLSPTVSIKGVGTDKEGTSVQHYSYAANMTYKDGLTTKQVKALPIEKYRLVGVKITVNGVTTDGELVNADGTHTGNADEDWYASVDLTKGDQTVEFQYAWNMADVTIKATFNGEPFPGYTDQVVEIEQNKQTTINAPNLSGYEPTQPSQDYTATGNTGEVTFEYTRVSSELIYRAVDEQGNELGTYSGGTILKGEAPRIAAQYAPKLNNYTLVNDTADGVATSEGTADKFDGTHPITVTFVYKPTTKTVSIYMVEYKDDGDHRGASLGFDNTTYKDITTGQTLNITAPAIAGYSVKIVAGDDELSETKSIFVTNDTNPQSVYFYYEKDEENAQYITVKMMDVTDANAPKLISSFKIPGVAGQAQLVTPPELHGYVTTDTAQTVKPDEELVTGQGEGVVIFNYTRNVYTVTVELRDTSVTPAKELSFPTANYPRSYEVVKGDSLTLTAPSIYGYVLKADTEAVKTVTPTEDTTVTFEYEPIDNQLVTIKVTGVTDGGQQLFQFSETVTFGTQSKDIAIFTIPGYKLKEATGGNVNGSVLTVDTSKANKGETIDVTLTYESNMVTVTVEAKYNGKTLQSYTISVVKDAATLITAPSIEGYEADKQNETITPTANTTVTFEYKKTEGNVTVIAVENGKELYRQDGGTVARGTAISAANFAAPTVTYYERTGTAPTIMVNGQQVNDGDNYEGLGQIEIIYEYQRKTTMITIVKKDADTRKDFNQNQDISGLNVGETYVFNQTVTTPNGYTAEADNPTSVFVEDRTGQQVVFWYRQNESDRYVTITVNLKCGNDLIQTYPVTAVKGQETVIKAPDLTGSGYKLATGQPDSQKITPEGDAAKDVVNFEYELDAPHKITIQLQDNTNNVPLTAPNGYETEYTLKKGDEITIQAPIMSGYTLSGYTLGGTSGVGQFVTVKYADIANGATLTFSYDAVENSSFVTHTVRFVDHLGNELYSYSKLVAKGAGAGTKIEYKASDVKHLIPGYALHEITYKVNNVDATENEVTNVVDAEITYVFTEDTAKIIVEQYNGTTKLDGDVELTGYRVGQTDIIVTAPARTDVALKDSLTKTVNGPLTATQTVQFQYEALANVRFYLYDAETGNLIAIKNGTAGETYKAGEGILDLSADHYTYEADDRADNEAFKPNGTGEVTAPNVSGVSEYSVYFKKATRKVTYIAMDSDKLSQDDFTSATDEQKDAAKITGLKLAAMPDARVGETYMATAQTFDGWTLDDDLTKPYTVAADQGNLEVYFWYKVRATGTVTVNYVFGTEGGVNNDTLASYTTKAAGGEKLTITPPQNLGDGRYTLNAGQTAQTIDVDRNGTHTVNFYYSKNFVTINTKVVLGNTTASQLSSTEVLKTGTADFFPPYRPGYKLVGVTGVTGGDVNKLPDGFANKVTISNPTADMDITWYYEQTDATEYQSTVTVKYLYRGLDLSKEVSVKAFLGVGNTIEVPAFDGYTAKTYTFKDGSGTESAATDITDASAGIVVKPNEKTAVLTITYERTDGSVVLPGKNDAIAPPQDKDNVTVTPGNGTQLEDDGKGGVKVPDNGTATVTRPDPDKPNDGKEDIIVPGGTTIDKDGTIHLPKNPDGTGGGTIDPDAKIPDALPADGDYVAITYDSNNGTLAVKKEIGKKGELEVKGELFTHPTNAKFEGWNDSGLGNGTPYAAGTKVDASIKLYAKWSANYTYRATITYKPNGGTPDNDVFQNVGHDTDPKLTVTLPNSHFQVSGWTFGGWNTKADGSGTLYQAGTTLTLKQDEKIELFAQWYKVNADGSIEVPGKDGNPNTTDDNATAKGDGKGNNPTRNETTGEITIPKGGSVILPDGSEIALPDGGKLLPDGTVIINRPDTDGDGKSEGTITIPGKDDPTKPDVTDKDGNKDPNAKVFTLTYTINNGENVDDVLVKVVENDEVSLIDCPFDWTGYTFINWIQQTGSVEHKAGDKFTVTGDETFHAQWMKINTDGSVELPGKDGSIVDADDNVIVTPDQGGKITPQPDGSVKVEDEGGTVNRPKNPDDATEGREDIKVPEGTIVDPDGTIHLPKKPDGSDGGVINPDDKLPGNTPAGYVSVVYKANGGTGDDVIVVVAEGTTITAIANPFTNGNQTFKGWNTAENGIGGTAYAKNATITVEAGSNSVTLYAQWGKSESYNHTAEITYVANDGVTAAIKDTVGANDSTTFSTTLRQNPFSVNGWTFGGWNSMADGTGELKAANAEIKVEAGKNQTWYAQWYKVNDDGSITVPGDGNPNTTNDNTTAKGNGTNDPERDEATGDIKIPAGGSVTLPDGSVIALPDGGILKPDGTVIINLPDTDNNGKPDNTITVPGENGKPDVKDEDGNTDQNATAVVLTYEANDGSGKTVKVYAVSGKTTKALAEDTFVYSGHKFLYWKAGNDTHKADTDVTPTGDMTLFAVWAKVNPDGSIELPGKDGKLEAPDDEDNVIVTPDKPNGSLEGPKADDGSVEVKGDEATVTRPDPEDAPNKEDIKVPEGTIIYPDGTIELPDGTKVTPDQPFPDDAGTYVTVTFKAGSGSGNTVKLVVAKNSDINLLDESVFVAPANHYFIGWTSGNKTYDANAQYTVTGAVTFTAEYKERAELTKAVAIFDYAGGVDTQGNGSKYVTGKAGTTITGIDDPTRTGYHFDGWDNALEFGAVGTVTVFTAQWTINEYDVTFEPGTDGSLDSGDANAVYQVEHDTSVTPIPTVTANTGKVFIGWLNSVDNSVYTADSLANYKVTGDVTFTAQYMDEGEATVIFVFAGGNVNGEHSMVKTGTPGTEIGTLPEPQREGYTFKGWDAAVAATTKFPNAGFVSVYTALWTENAKQTFEVTFDIDATKGSTTDTTSEQVEDGGFVTTVPTVTPEAGYKFVGWKDQDGKLFYEAGVKLYPITKGTTFTAVFERIDVNPGTATVIFDANGGKIGNNTVLTRVGVPGAVIGEPTQPTRPGYQFLGWSDGFDANTTYGAADTVTTYVAQWKAIEYTIHFSATGATGSTADQTYTFDGNTANALNRNGFQMTGKKFVGWSLTEGAATADYADGALINDALRAALAASNTNSVTLYAVWQDAQANTLTVTGNKSSAKPGETVDFTAYLNGTATTDVTWIVSGGKTGTSISANGVLTVGSSETNGTTLTVTAIYKLDTGLTASATVRVVVDGGNTGGGGGGTVTTSYTINASAGKGGTISPDGTVKVSRGDNKTFTIAASNGYIIADVLVDGVSVGAVSSYTFTKVSKDHTISVTFKEARPGVADPSETGVDKWLRVTDHISYMHGYDNGNFGPMDNLTRAQAAQLFYRLLVNQDVTITVSFSDVPADAWYAKAVNTLASLGIIKGIGNGKFDPDREISRAEFVVIATRFAKTIDKVSSPFVDVADDAWYAPYVATATSYGWITGVGEGRFAPDDLVTRAEAATIVNRMLARSADRDFIDGNAVQQFPDVTPNDWYYYQVMEAVNGHSHRYGEDGYEIWNGLN